MHKKIIILLIVGVVTLTATAVFAVADYNSSRSNTSTAIVNQQVGDILLRYGIGGAEINQVTDALAVGIDEDKFIAMLSEIGLNDSGITELLAKLDELGTGAPIGETGAVATIEEGTVSAPAAGVEEEKAEEPAEESAAEEPVAEESAIKEFDSSTPILFEGKAEESAEEPAEERAAATEEIFGSYPSPSEVSVPDTGDIPQPTEPGVDIFIEIDGVEGEEKSTPDTGDAPPSGFKEISGIESETEIIEYKDGDDMTARRGRYGDIVLKRSVFQDAAMGIIRNIRSAAPEERDDLIDKLRTTTGTFQTEILSMSLAIRDNAKDLRDNFRKATVTIKLRDDQGVAPKLCEAVCKGRITIAHGKGLLLVYRYRSALARFDDILGRIESRVARKQWLASNFAVRISIEEAKNKQLENEATLEVLTATYESLLAGENPQGVAEEAREIAKELKTEIKTLHAKLRDIVNEIRRVVETGPPTERKEVIVPTLDGSSKDPAYQ